MSTKNKKNAIVVRRKVETDDGIGGAAAFGLVAGVLGAAFGLGILAVAASAVADSYPSCTGYTTSCSCSDCYEIRRERREEQLRADRRALTARLEARVRDAELAEKVRRLENDAAAKRAYLEVFAARGSRLAESTLRLMNDPPLRTTAPAATEDLSPVYARIDKVRSELALATRRLALCTYSYERQAQQNLISDLKSELELLKGRIG